MTSPSSLRACVRCGIRRQVKNAGRESDLCADCKATEPNWPAATIPRARAARPLSRWSAEEGGRVVRAIVQIAQRVEVETRQRHRCCEACGCLIFAWERCPNCALAAVGEVAS